MNNISRRHHYLPRHYLKGFTDSQNLFYVYDKKEDRIIPQTTPDSAFFEKNLNTVVFPDGSHSDFLESLYANLENKSWNSFDFIRNSNPQTHIEPLHKMHLFLFLLSMFWTLPVNRKTAEQLSVQFLSENNDLDYIKLKHKNGEAVRDELIEEMRSSRAFKKVSKVLLPFAPLFKNKLWGDNLANWRFYYTGDQKSWYLVGDNPIVSTGKNDHDPVNCLNEFIFPVSGKVLLVNIKGPSRQQLPPKTVIQFNISIIDRAQRFVACQDKGFLEWIIKDYKLHIEYGKTKAIVPEMFDMLKTDENERIAG